MGTSASHRSPATPEWDRVRELYQEPHPAPGQIVSRIIAALDPATRHELHDQAVVGCLDTLVWGSAAVAEQGLEEFLAGFPAITEPPVVALAADLRDRATNYIVASGAASRFGELAVDALSNTVLSVAAGEQGLLTVRAAQAEDNYASFARQGNLSQLGVHFFAHDFDRVFRYFVTRDLSDFIGTEALPTVSAGSRLEDQVARYCRSGAQQIDLSAYEDQLQQIVTLPIHDRIQRLQPLAAKGIIRGLEVLAGGA